MKLSEKAFNFAQKLLKVYNKEEDKSNSNTNLKESDTNSTTATDEKRVIGKTDYKKYEDMAKNMELEEITTDPKTKEVLKMGCNNDLRKERQLMDKPSKDKIEAAKLFKNEGDDYLKTKNYADAINSYEKGLLQLFYTFSDDPEEDKKVDTIKVTINMNLSMCKINLNKFEDAIGYLQETLRVDKNNLKALYRIAYSYFKLEKFEESRKYISEGLKLDPDNAEFKSLTDSIINREKEMEEQSRKLFKKIKLN
jgi:tetratricopeptide (TPR) repeat protein